MRTADPELTRGAERQTLAVGVHDEELEVIQRLADRYVLLVLADRIGRGEDRTLRRTVAVMQLVVGRRIERREGFAAHRYVEQRVTIDIRGELVTDLRGHERVRYALGIEVTTELRQVQTQVFRHDIDRCTAGERRIQIHHTGIETKAGVGCHLVSGMQVVVAPVPMAERHEVAVLEHHTLGHAG